MTAIPNQPVLIGRALLSLPNTSDLTLGTIGRALKETDGFTRTCVLIFRKKTPEFMAIIDCVQRMHGLIEERKLEVTVKAFYTKKEGRALPFHGDESRPYKGDGAVFSPHEHPLRRLCDGTDIATARVIRLDMDKEGAPQIKIVDLLQPNWLPGLGHANGRFRAPNGFRARLGL